MQKLKLDCENLKLDCGNLKLDCKKLKLDSEKLKLDCDPPGPSYIMHSCSYDFLYTNTHVKQRMQPLQSVSIKVVISLTHMRFVKAFSVMADLLAVGNFCHSLGPNLRRECLP